MKMILRDAEAVEDAIWDAVRNEMERVYAGRDVDEATRRHEANDMALCTAVALEKWIEDGKYIEIEFDLDSMTATVVP